MFVVATAGHVDHGKSTLVRALTGMEPDRWAEERRRGLTIDLGFAWTGLPSGRPVAFVDVPGHERFLGNMLAGLGPAPVVCFVVAADEGWQAQSDDHRDAVAALGIEHGLLVVSRADRAADGGARALAQARERLSDTGLRDAPAVTVALPGRPVEPVGLDELRTTLDRVLDRVPAGRATGRVRLWLDRSFPVTGAGTVVTGTLAAGTLLCDDRIELSTPAGLRAATVRGLQTRGISSDSIGPVNRVGVNLRGVPADQVGRGDALLTPGAWPHTAVVDVRRTDGRVLTDLPAAFTVHVGTAALPARLRPFDHDHARLLLERAVPLTLGDRLLMREPSSGILGGVRVLDAEPPPLRRRGDGARRAADLRGLPDDGDARFEVRRRRVVRFAHLQRLGVLPDGRPAAPDGVVDAGPWWIDRAVHQDWQTRLRDQVLAVITRDPLSAGLSERAAIDLLDLPDPALLDGLVAATGLRRSGGHLRPAGAPSDLGPAEPAVASLEERLRAAPFLAPEADDLIALGLGVRELAAAARVGRLLRLPGGIVLLPSAPAQAMRLLAALGQPFTTSAARSALGTTRRVVIPLLEHLDGRGWTRRTDAGHREVVTARRPVTGGTGTSR